MERLLRDATSRVLKVTNQARQGAIQAGAERRFAGRRCAYRARNAPPKSVRRALKRAPESSMKSPDFCRRRPDIRADAFPHGGMMTDKDQTPSGEPRCRRGRAGRRGERAHPPVVIEKLNAENGEMKERVLRTLAEMENLRRPPRRKSPTSRPTVSPTSPATWWFRRQSAPRGSERAADAREARGRCRTPRRRSRTHRA